MVFWERKSNFEFFRKKMEFFFFFFVDQFFFENVKFLVVKFCLLDSDKLLKGLVLLIKIKMKQKN